MEKGSFQTSVKSVLEMDDFVENLPLPNQMPKQLDFSQLPVEAMRSSAVETLIGQNNDLMARLGVSLRKAGVLEEKLREMEKENLHLRHRYDAVKDQVLVVQEKERLLSERSNQIGAETDDLRKRVEVVQERYATLERRYVEIYAYGQDLERTVRRFRTYRQRVQKVTDNLRVRANRLFDYFQSQPASSKSIGTAISLAERELKNVRGENSEAQLQLVSRFETEIAEARKAHGSALEQTRAELELLRRKAADRDLLYEAKTRIENQLIFNERQSTLYREETQRDLQSTKTENQDLRSQLKTRLIEIDRMTREIEVALEKIMAHEQEDREKVDQIESLQLLWKEKQAEVERLKEKNRSLQKLNQELSVNLNGQRKEIIDLKADAEKDRFIAQEKIKALETQLIR